MLKNLILQKGWAGKTISRTETVERLNPIIRQLITLNHHYEAFVRSSMDAALGSRLEPLQKTARMDVGKLAETVFSCGGTAYSGIDLKSSDFSVPGGRTEATERLESLERSFIERLASESKVEHQMRTRAILSVVKQNSEARLHALTAGSR